ncbi:MAG TPA: S8 family serine peptidase, partial [Chloroflexota bacterium]
MRLGVACALIAVLVGIEPFNGGSGGVVRAAGGNATSTGAAPHGLVNVMLAAQLRPLEKAWHNFSPAGGPRPTIPLEVRSSRDVSGAIRSLGGRIEADINGRITAAVLPVDAVAVLAREPGVEEVDPSLPVHQQLDQSVPEIGANSVWNLTAPSGLPLQGAHVLIGIVDSGIDYRNPDFKNPDGSTRIKYIWDQTQEGHAPSGYDFGYECDAASINSGACPEKDTDGHGTHVAGIAAGNGLSSTPAREIGVAPQADIIVVKYADSTDKLIAAWKYLVDKARTLGEPIVINNSFGRILSPHDGSADEDLAIDGMAGPGRIFVAAAGNEGNLGEHADGNLTQGGTASIPMTTNGQDSQINLGLFFPSADDVRLTLRNLDTGQTVGPVAMNDATTGKVSQDGDTVATLVSGQASNTARAIVVQLQTNSGSPISGHYGLDLQGTTIADAGRYDAWIEEDDGASFDHPDEADTIDTPADGRNVIAVGDYASKITWTDKNNQQHNVCDGYPCQNKVLRLGDIVSFSSSGPTADGRQKPDLVAPGTMIVSSLSRDAPICVKASDPNCLPQEQITSDGKNLAESGTSASAPHVAGVAALMLQANSTLDQATVTSILRSTARHDAFTGTAVWTPTFGAGKVDALAAVQTVLKLPHPTPLPTLSPSPTASPTPTPVPTATVLSSTVQLSALRLQTASKKGAAAVRSAKPGSTAYL